MNFKKWILEQPNTSHIGEVAVFYVPSEKLTKTIRSKMHNFFVQNYDAYTHETSKIQGYWTKNNKILKDKHERYEVSFSGEDNLKKFISFLSNICEDVKEDCIYLSVGNDSYLINPK